MVNELTRSGPITYNDHTGLSILETWKAQIENKRPDIAAVGAVCILDLINGKPCSDRAYLKWGSRQGYQRTLLPLDHGLVDLFNIRADRPGMFLLSALDVTPRQPIVTNDGDYELSFKIFAEGFPLLQFTVIFNLQWRPATPISWVHHSSANLKA